MEVLFAGNIFQTHFQQLFPGVSQALACHIINFNELTWFPSNLQGVEEYGIVGIVEDFTEFFLTLLDFQFHLLVIGDVTGYGGHTNHPPLMIQDR